jgi:hypothetical protein
MRFKPQAANDYERRVTRRRKDGYDVSMEEMQPPRVAKTARFPRRRNYCGWRMHHAGTKTRVTKTAAKKSESTDQDSQQQRSFVIRKPSYIDFIQRISLLSQSKAMAQNPVKQKVKTEPKKCVTANTHRLQGLQD